MLIIGDTILIVWSVCVKVNTLDLKPIIGFKLNKS